MTDNNDQGDTRRTKRRYAHEAYPHSAEGEIRPLAVEVPYLLARAVGLDIDDTSWMQAEPRTLAGDRISLYLEAALIALMADAMHQGLTGDEAYTWARSRVSDDSTGEWLWERSYHYGVDAAWIKPYSCGPEPITHDHFADMATRSGIVTRIPLRESECHDCTEPIEQAL